MVTRVYTWWFDLPLYGFVPFITERLRLETDFENEAKNSETMRDLINGEPSMRGRVYVPQVYREFSTKRVLTTEWIEGVRLRDKETLTRPWYGGHGKGSPGVRRQTLASPGADAANRGFPLDSNNRGSKSENPGWRGPRGKGGLGVSTKDVMTIMIDLFSAQIFKWGVVHCDPHPGNIFIRRLETGKPELVLIDHGLYVYMSEEFRREYSRFWKAMMTYDNKTLKEISTGWGINSVDLFASATLMRPYEGDKGELKNKILAATDGKTASERSYEMQRRMKQGIRSMLADETKWPQELIFIGRNMRIVQANNQSMGSPVNRIKMMGNWASRSMYEDRSLPLRERLRNAYRHLLFRGVLVLSDVAFYFFKLRAWLGIGRNMEDEVEARMKDVAKDFGVELQHDVFEG